MFGRRRFGMGMRPGFGFGFGVPFVTGAVVGGALARPNYSNQYQYPYYY